MKKRVIVISFLGEFGYELLNWQGKVRRVHDSLVKNNERDNYFIIVASRNGLNNFYENCDYFVELSNFDSYNNTIANNYTFEGGLNTDELKEQIYNFVKSNCLYIKDNDYSLGDFNCFWSHNTNKIYGVEFDHGTIYEDCDIKINKFVKIEPDLTYIEQISNEVGFDITKENYIYIQSGFRNIVTRSKKIIDFDYIFDKISDCKHKIILSNFFTNRSNDTITRYGKFETNIVNVPNFKKQSCLINFAIKNIFFSEGDFRSHNYVPPFLGKDVYSVAYDDVFSIGTTPIEYWNDNIFNFGGKIIPIKLKDKLESYDQIFKIINE